MVTMATQMLPMDVTFDQRGRYMYTRAIFHVAPGVLLHVTSKVDLAQIEQMLRDGNPDVSGIFGAIFKGIKKAVSVVGKATGLNKVVQFAGKILKNPVVQAILPGAAIAAKGADIAKDLVTAVAAKKAGHPAAKKALVLAAAKAKQAGWDKPEFDKQAEKIYKLIISPE